ncbi:MAG TPA: hypothetical protein VH637_05030 [Streptosporangiaceae bacterium]
MSRPASLTSIAPTENAVCDGGHSRDSSIASRSQRQSAAVAPGPSWPRPQPA